MSPKARKSSPKAGKVLSVQDAQKLRALEDQINSHIKNLNSALGTLKKVGNKVGAMRRRHYGVRCGV
jgi:hypothetical protein